MERNDYRRMSDDALAQVVSNELNNDRLREQLATCEAHRRTAEARLTLVTSALRDLVNAAKHIDESDLAPGVVLRFAVNMQHARELLASADGTGPT